jgi:hypothetical protein
VRSLSLRLRALLALLAGVLAVGFGSRAVVSHVVARNVEAASGDALMRAAQVFAGLERADVEKLSAALNALSGREDLKAAFVARDRERLYALAAPLYRTLKERDGVTHWYFIEPEPARSCFLRVHRPEKHGDVIDRATLARAMQTKQVGFGKEMGKTAFALRVVQPYYDGAKLIGYLELGEEIDHFLRRMKEQTGDDFGLLVKKQYLDEKAWAAASSPRPSNWNDRPEVVLVKATSYGEGIIDYRGRIDDVPERGQVLEKTARDGRTFIRGIFPVRDAAGRLVGALFVRHEVTAMHEALASGRDQTGAAVLALAVLASALLFLLLYRLVFARLSRAVAAAEQLSARLPPGRHGAGGEIITASGDELTRLEDFFARFSASLEEPGQEGRPKGD